jgi:hypothetical protein
LLNAPRTTDSLVTEKSDVNPDAPAIIRQRLTSPVSVCRGLGLLDGYRYERQGQDGLTIRCPAHGDQGPSCSVTRGPDGTIRVRCFSGCGLAGDVFHLIAAARSLDVRRDFAEVLRLGADLANVSLDEPMPVSEPAPSKPPPTFPDEGEREALWALGQPVSSDEEASGYLTGRALDADLVDLYGLARVLPKSAPCPPWARVSGASWAEAGYRLLVPVYDETGAMRSLRAWSLKDRHPKRVAPAGCSTAGLVMSCGLGRAVLETGGAPGCLDGARIMVVIVEGEPDFLTWGTRISDANETPWITFGVVSSAWSPAIAARIPDGARVVIRTHLDPAGYRYADAIRSSLKGRATIYDLPRTRPSHGR